jgi:hypothetical protein
VSIISRFFRKSSKDPNSLLHRKDVLVRQLDFLADTLENSKFDIVYMENLKAPLSPEERVYFLQQVDRLESAKNIIWWLKSNVISHETFWTRLLKW